MEDEQTMSEWRIPERILIKPDHTYSLDKYDGLARFYRWSKIPVRDGGYLSSINHYLTELQSSYPLQSNRIDILLRKIAYLQLLQHEIKYISKRFKWDVIEEMRELFLSKFENYAVGAVECMIYAINTYETIFRRKSDDSVKIKRFEDILPFLVDLKMIKDNKPKIFLEVLYTLLINVRNCLVHRPNKVDYLNNDQNPILYLQNVEKMYRKEMDDFIRYLFSNKYRGRKDVKTYQNYDDDEFSFVEIHFWITKKAKVDPSKSRISFRISILDLVSVIYMFLFDLLKCLFN